MPSPRVTLALLAVIGAFAVLISLGNWQMRRLAWKEDLIATVEERMNAAPVEVRAGSAADLASPQFLEENEYRTVILNGVFVPRSTVRSYTALSDPSGPLQGPGYWILTLLRVQGGPGLFVNRGFVPFDHAAALPPPPAGIVRVSGIVRSPDTGNFMTPAPDLDKRIWYVRNIPQIASTLALDGDILPFFIDADASMTPAGGLPQAGETRTSFTNSHLQYAITWYGLAAALACVFGVYVCTRRRSIVP